MSFFQVFYEKPPAVKPIYGQKTSNLSKLHFFGLEKTIGCPSVLIFHGKKKRRRAWTPGRFCEVATGALRLLPLKVLAQNVQDYALLEAF